MQARYSHERSVRPSVCQMRELWQNESTWRKSSIMTNRKLTTSFRMSIRWTVYVARKSPKGARKPKFCLFFPLNSVLLSKKDCCILRPGLGCKRILVNMGDEVRMVHMPVFAIYHMHFCFSLYHSCILTTLNRSYLEWLDVHNCQTTMNSKIQILFHL